MSQSNTIPELGPTLEKFETAIISPIVSGELIEWIASANEAMQELCLSMRRQFVAVHQKDFAEIARQDPELSSCVQQLQNEDATIAHELQHVQQRLASLAELAELAESDELRIAAAREKIAAQCVALVLRIRTQEAAAATWLTEAFQRDRGDGD